jgi:tetratricopeptide (TPR) repeat protein
MAQQKFPKAYEAYQQAVYRDGRNPTFWCSIGVLYYQINQYRDALDAYSRAIRLNPYISEVWYDLGTLVCQFVSFATASPLIFDSMKVATTRQPMLWMLTLGLPSSIQAISISKHVCNFYVVAVELLATSTMLQRLKTFIPRPTRQALVCLPTPAGADRVVRASSNLRNLRLMPLVSANGLEEFQLSINPTVLRVSKTASRIAKACALRLCVHHRQDTSLAGRFLSHHGGRRDLDPCANNLPHRSFSLLVHLASRLLRHCLS